MDAHSDFPFQSDPMNDTLARALLSDALKAICLTRDYVEPKVSLPALPGWTWYDTGIKIAASIPMDPWAKAFMMRVKAYYGFPGAEDDEALAIMQEEATGEVLADEAEYEVGPSNMTEEEWVTANE